MKKIRGSTLGNVPQKQKKKYIIARFSNQYWDHTFISMTMLLKTCSIHVRQSNILKLYRFSWDMKLDEWYRKSEEKNYEADH